MSSTSTISASRDAAKGKLRAPQRERFGLPPKGTVWTYILSSAQNNTLLHEACWESLLTYAAYCEAAIMVASLTYKTNAQSAKGQKKTAKESMDESEWWDERVEPYLHDTSIEIAPGLVWCGELQILPTAANPLSGLESYTGRDSSIIPHTSFAAASVPSPKRAGTKFLFTTGAVTQRNYIQKKAGQVAEFHHGYGALIVEVNHEGSWWVRQLNADSEGVLYDIRGGVVTQIDGSKVTTGHRIEALVWGDLHTRQLEAAMRELGWGPGGIVDTLRPRRQVFHDVLDFRSQNHHDRADPWKTFEKRLKHELSVADEIKELAVFLDYAARPWCETVVAAANHDEALLRWLREAEFRFDPLNAEFYLTLNLRIYKAIKAGTYRPMNPSASEFHPLAWAVGRSTAKKVRFLRRDEDYSVHGIKLDMHGDKGANGGKGSKQTWARSGMKTITGDAHSPFIYQGAMGVGVMGSLDQGYNEGLSSWSHTNAVVYPNGKRTLFTIWKGRAWA